MAAPFPKGGKGGFKGKCGKGMMKGWQEEVETYMEPIMAPPPGIPPFIGGASRKRRAEVMAEKGLLPHWYHAGFLFYPPSAAGGYPQAPLPSGGYNGGAHAPRPGGGRAPLRTPAQPSMQEPAKRVKPPKKTPAAPAAPAVETAPDSGEAVRWITLDSSSSLVQQGLPELGPIVTFGASLQATGLLSSSGTILSELIGEEANTAALTHDSNWDVFPEVGAAYKESGGEELCLCVAVSEEHGKWGVGVAGKWKAREQSAKLSLCVALAANAEDFSAVASQYPGFVELCEGAGITTGALGGGGAPASQPWKNAGKRKRGGKGKGKGSTEEDQPMGDGAAEPDPLLDLPFDGENETEG